MSGTPEVDATVTYASDLKLTGWDVSGYYCPIAITVGTETLYGYDYDSITSFEAAVEAKINALTETFQANTAIDAESLVVTWAWAYTADGVKQTDAKDTALGDAAAAGNASTITLDITCTITQDD